MVKQIICTRSTNSRCFGGGGDGGGGGSGSLLFLERGKEDEWSWEVGGWGGEWRSVRQRTES